MDKLREVIEVINAKEIIDIVIALVILAVFILLRSIFAKIIMKCFRIKQEKPAKKSKIYKLLKFIWLISGIYISLLFLGLPGDFMAIISKIYKLTLIYSITRLVANLIMPSAKIFDKMKFDSESKNKYTVNFAIKFLRVIIYIIGTFVFIAELGYDLSGLITGLGIGSVVIALAAQDLAKNLFGGVAILTDKTFVIGDTIQVNNVFGVVEDITFRTTRIRQADNTIITMPNSILSDSDIINWNKVKKRRYDCDLKLSLQTSQKQINDLIKKLSFELQKNKNLIKDSIRVYFSGIERDAYNIKIYLYTEITDWDEYIEFVSNINSQVLALLEYEGIKLIHPTYDINMVK